MSQDMLNKLRDMMNYVRNFEGIFTINLSWLNWVWNIDGFQIFCDQEMAKIA